MRPSKPASTKASPGQAAQRTDTAAKAIIAAETDARETQVARLRAARLEHEALVAALPKAPKPARKPVRR